jgi:hypothetical protein
MSLGGHLVVDSLAQCFADAASDTKVTTAIHEIEDTFNESRAVLAVWLCTRHFAILMRSYPDRLLGSDGLPAFRLECRIWQNPRRAMSRDAMITVKYEQPRVYHHAAHGVWKRAIVQDVMQRVIEAALRYLLAVPSFISALIEATIARVFPARFSGPQSTVSCDHDTSAHHARDRRPRMLAHAPAIGSGGGHPVSSRFER